MNVRAFLWLPVFSLFLASAVRAEENASPVFSSWIVYWDFPDSFQEAKRHATIFKELGLFCYQFNPEGRLIPGAPAMADGLSKLRAQPRQEKLVVWTTVANDVVKGSRRDLKDPAIVHTVLSTPESRLAHIQELLQISTGSDGLEIDYENMEVQDREHFSNFIRELAEALHSRQQRLAVVLQPKTTDDLQNGAGAVDWAAVGASADLVKVMAYPYQRTPGQPGPVAPPEWVESLARFALDRIPAEKLGIVLTVGGFEWRVGRPGRSIDYRAALHLARLRGAKVERDPATASPHFSYRDGSRQEVWFEDAQSLQHKIQLLRSLGIQHIGFWRLGAGDPAFWSELKNPSASPTP